MVKIKDLNNLNNPDNLSIVYFLEDGLTYIEKSLAELVDQINERIRDFLLPPPDSISSRLSELGILLEMAVEPAITGSNINLDYIYEDKDHAIWFNIENKISSDLGFLTFTINGQEKPLYLRESELETSYLNGGYYLIVFSKTLQTYTLNPILPRGLGFVNTKKYSEGIFSDLISITDYNFLYISDNYTGIIEESLFYDLNENLLFDALSYTLRVIKTRMSEVLLEGYSEVYNVVRSINGQDTITTPTEIVFIPESKAFYLYKN